MGGRNSGRFQPGRHSRERSRVGHLPTKEADALAAIGVDCCRVTPVAQILGANVLMVSLLMDRHYYLSMRAVSESIASPGVVSRSGQPFTIPHNTEFAARREFNTPQWALDVRFHMFFTRR